MAESALNGTHEHGQKIWDSLGGNAADAAESWATLVVRVGDRPLRHREPIGL